MALFWRNNDEVEIKNYSRWHINVEINSKEDGKKMVVYRILWSSCDMKKEVLMGAIKAFEAK